nr:immunoglobulin heavy chain junction region [Mus musculus]MBK4189670.1 immunoglobulin heavy chain junction region [Mus musculus]
CASPHYYGSSVDYW